MSKSVLIAVAMEMDGHASADAIRTTVPNYESEVSVKNTLKKHLLEDQPNEKIGFTHISRSKDKRTWHVYGWLYWEDYPFAAIVAPSNFTHINTGTG